MYFVGGTSGGGASAEVVVVDEGDTSGEDAVQVPDDTNVPVRLHTVVAGRGKLYIPYLFRLKTAECAIWGSGRGRGRTSKCKEPAPAICTGVL